MSRRVPCRIISHHFHVTPEIRQHVEACFSRMPLGDPSPLNAEIYLEEGDDGKTAKGIIHARPDLYLEAGETRDSLEEAIEALFRRLQEELEAAPEGEDS